MALADVYDALTSERCYKKAFDHETAINMIWQGECGAFNPLLLECLMETASQLRAASNLPAKEKHYQFDVNRLSNEIMAHAKVLRNDRVQRLLDSMQERVDFFASCSGGIQFSYDSRSQLADVVN